MLMQPILVQLLPYKVAAEPIRIL